MWDVSILEKSLCLSGELILLRENIDLFVVFWTWIWNQCGPPSSKELSRWLLRSTRVASKARQGQQSRRKSNTASEPARTLSALHSTRPRRQLRTTDAALLVVGRNKRWMDGRGCTLGCDSKGQAKVRRSVRFSSDRTAWNCTNGIESNGMQTDAGGPQNAFILQLRDESIQINYHN